MMPMKRGQNWLPYVFNDLFDNNWMIKANSTAPAINVIESEKEYRVEVAAPGMTKDDFKIRIDENDNLVVCMEKREEKNEEKKEIVLILKVIDGSNDFWSAFIQGAEIAAKEYEVELCKSCGGRIKKIKYRAVEILE